MPNKLTIRDRLGVSLIETVVALMILGVIGGALLFLIAQVTATVNSANFKNQATTYAEEAVEQVRDFRNVNGFNGLVTAAGICGGQYDDGQLVNCVTSASCTACPGGLTGCLIATATNYSFCRRVQLTQNGSQVHVQSFVGWLEKGVTKNVQVDSYLYQY